MPTQPEVLALEDSVNSWQTMFTDVVDGKDIAHWQRLFSNVLGPAALFGQKFPKRRVSIGRVIEDGECARLSFPCFFDDDPLSTSQFSGRGVKVRFHGKRADGAIVVTDRALVVLEMHDPAVITLSAPLDRIAAINELQFKVSLMSMTSAGPGYEIMIDDVDETMARILFRMAVTPRDKQSLDRSLKDLLLGRSNS